MTDPYDGAPAEWRAEMASLDARTPEPERPATGAKYFHPDYGLRASLAARAVGGLAPLRLGVDDRFWGYLEGAWAPCERALHQRIVALLGDRWRPHHSQAIRGVLQAEVEELRLDPVPAYVNVINGMVEWGAAGGARLIRHDPLYLSTVQLPVAWRPDATCPRFDRFLEDVVEPDDVARVWEILGYLMMSGNPLQRAFLLTGGGGNGKGVFLEVVKRLLGDVNCAAVPLREFDTSTWATAELLGRLANVCGDIDATYLENTARIKEVTGEDTVKGERKFGQPFYFRPWCKMIFSANDIPASSDSSRGWTRRWEVVSFPNEALNPDPGLKQALTTVDELQGIAAHALRSLAELMARRDFSHGAAAAAVKTLFEQRSNKLLMWLEEDTDQPNPSKWYDRRDLFKQFKRWDEIYGGGGRGMGSTSFYSKLRQVHGMREAKRNGQWGFWGLRLKTDIMFGEVIDLETEEDDLPEAGGKELPPGYTQPELGF